MQVEVTAEDRAAAASGYYAWISSNPVIPNKMLDGFVDDHSMVQAFARHRIEATRTLEAQIAELREALEGQALAHERLIKSVIKAIDTGQSEPLVITRDLLRAYLDNLQHKEPQG
jgi:hypothetical protein